MRFFTFCMLLSVLTAAPTMIFAQLGPLEMYMFNPVVVCDYEFEEQGSTMIDGTEKAISQELHCDCGSASCSREISYSHTEQWTHTVAGQLAPLEMVDALKGILNLSYSYAFGETATQTSTVNCEINPGKKVWLTIIPKLVQKTGWGTKKCHNTQEAWITEGGHVTVTVPVKASNGELVGQVWCRTDDSQVCK